MPSPVLSLTWKLSFSFTFGSHNTRPAAYSNGLKELSIDHKETKLSAPVQTLQRNIRQRALKRLQPIPTRKPKQKTIAHERLADAESLRVLESVTAEQSELARGKDQESLATLLRHSEGKTMSMATSGPKTPEHQIIRYEDFAKAAPLVDAAPFSTPSAVQRAIANGQGHIKGLNGSPRSFEPSWSTSPSDRGEPSFSGSDNEFEEFMTRSVGRRGSAASKSNKFSALLRSVKSAPAGDNGGMTKMSQTAKSVIQLMKAAEEKDGEDERDVEVGKDEGRRLMDAGDPFDNSPTSRIKRLPKSLLLSSTEAVGGTVMVERLTTKGSVVSLRRKHWTGDQDSLTASSDRYLDDGTGWDVVGADSPEFDKCDWV